MIQFYSPNIEESKQLTESDSQHCIKVLRMKEGDDIYVVDGKGFQYICKIIEAHRKHVYLSITEKIELPNHWKGNINIAIAPTKNLDRMEWMAEKSTEIGIDRITPLLCRHSERKELKAERLHKILVAAMKQSLKSVIPQLDDMTPFSQFVNNAPEGQKFIAYCDADTERKILAQEYKPGSNVTILIGPEGDFSPEEVDEAIKAGFIPISLGNSRLRTETAAIFALAEIHTINQLNNL